MIRPQRGQGNLPIKITQHQQQQENKMKKHKHEKQLKVIPLKRRSITKFMKLRPVGNHVMYIRKRQ